MSLSKIHDKYSVVETGQVLNKLTSTCTHYLKHKYSVFHYLVLTFSI